MSLNIIHTSDWHLGKKLFKYSRVKEQIQFLDFLQEAINSNKCDVLIISGDIFDTPYPPSDAISIYLKFLYEITTKHNVKVFIISGNHDSGRFLETQKPFFDSQGITIRGHLDIKSASDLIVQVENNKGVSCSITLLPYFRSSDILSIGRTLYPDLLKEDDISESILLILESLFKEIANISAPDSFNILMGHHLFAGYEASGSEQGLSLSGIDQLPLSLVRGLFQYIALGHIHKFKIIQKESPTIIYSGSPIPFRFSENEQKKLAFIRINSKTNFDFTTIDIPSFKKLITLNCAFEELLLELEKIKNDLPVSDDDHFLYADIKFKDPVMGIPEVIKNELKSFPIKLIGYQARYHDENRTLSKFDHNNEVKLLTPKELFESYYFDKHPDSELIPKELLSDFIENLDEYLSLTKEKGVRL
ncbi:MAG: exonuclease SbcCD subunit D [Bacteriovoracaceae bacterium]|jgi:DNA repair protein SbcD/Mre11|nr:exonuclease SbcCD subunit D [Bacteriovoracaceae bacterium]